MKLRRNLRNTFVQFFETGSIILFLLGAFALAVSGNAAYDLMVGVTDISRSKLWLAFFAPVLVVVGVGVALWLRGRGYPSPSVSLGPEETAEARDGLVLFLSQGKGKADEEALSFHQPKLKQLWLLVTDEVAAERRDQEITDWCESQIGITPYRIPLVQPRDAMACHDAVGYALTMAAQKGLRPHDLYVDITGCLRPSAIGATLACLETGHDIEYVYCTYVDGKCAPGTSQVMRVTTRRAEGK